MEVSSDLHILHMMLVIANIAIIWEQIVRNTLILIALNTAFIAGCANQVTSEDANKETSTQESGSHETSDHRHSETRPNRPRQSAPTQTVASENSSMAVMGERRCMTTDSMPNHPAGPFRNGTEVKPNWIELCVPLNPVKNSVASPLGGAMGVALNGIQFKPRTSGYFDPSAKRGNSTQGDKNWSFDIASAPNQRGLDLNNAHVGKVDSYHYHSIPVTLIENLKGQGQTNTLIGYAADGFEMHYVGDQVSSGYKLKSGTRPSNPGPGGTYDGTYNEDFEFTSTATALDKCNMGLLNGRQVYFITNQYPFVPRCLWGEVSEDFIRSPRYNSNRRGQTGQEDRRNRRPKQ